MSVLAAVLLAAPAFADEIHTQILVTKLTKQEFLDINHLGMDILEYKGDSLEIIAKPADLEWLDSREIPYEVEVSDLVAFYKGRNKESLSMGGFMTYSEIVSYLDTLKAHYPTIMTSKFSLGQSIEGNDIWAVKVSDNPNVDEDEPELLYISLIHAREPAAAGSLLNFLNYMLSNYGVNPEITDLINNREFYFVPVQNPDGYLYNQATNPTGGGLWRKNRRLNGDATFGVDLNRNYGYKWGFDEIGSTSNTNGETYRGTGPFSEPETQIIRDFTISRHFVIVHNFHTYSDLELWPPGYDRLFSPFDDLFKNIGDSLTKFSGYTPEVGWRLYPTNGAADDWCWGDTISKPRIISFTCEIGGGSDGFWPPPANIPGLLAENVWPNLFLARIAAAPYVLGPPLSPTAYAPDSITKSASYTLKWSSDDTLNPPVSYTLNELIGKSTAVDDAESDHGYWTTERYNLTGTRKHSGASSWHELGANRANHWLVAKTPYLVKPNDSLRFWIWYAIEQDWDYFYAQVSTDGGFYYTNLANNLTTNTSPHGLNLGNGITGSSNNWIQAKFNLASYAGQQILVRLSYFTDDFTRGEGIYLDDIENIDLFASDNVFASGITDTFYNVTGKSPGDYWYRVSATDAQSQVSHLSNLVNAHVSASYLPGDANNDGTASNILDLTYLVDFIFRGGPLPNPYLGGDATCDTFVNILDLTFVVNRIFRGGAPPPPSCP